MFYAIPTAPIERLSFETRTIWPRKWPKLWWKIRPEETENVVPKKAAT
jgi:hypothetical protein